MREAALITGGGSGIGRALAHVLAGQFDMTVFIVGRRMAKLRETAQPFPKLIHPIAADVASDAGRAAIETGLGQTRLRFLVHNAGVLEPVKPLLAVTLEEWRAHMAVNVEGPLFLTRLLLPRLQKGARILHISSGAAHHAYAGWGAYCTSKAALHMIYRVLKEELAASGILIGSVRPGVVDTPMQDRVRQAAPEVFPALSKFLRLKEEGKLISPQTSAQFIARLLTAVPDDRFGQQEWDIREHSDILPDTQ
ncbi:MAG TPA: SDR family NAD(P)-dependent oxidoreductase [Caldithrix abyssi]|uniref:SDR family NAD(P)-dependent oxidoreductase n=1 Tax=Caldithrix abyssi TaxID=187145 RepID=A0A7V5PN86_CALAY|nr:SDR family NAD(P)-dependent oxidoreductase [Caldithrix abyssi]